ncbi:MAG: 3-oxoacyl-[acyl-carrier-protein] synthase, KASII [uncultured Chthoniobacterales bacterium]|uniref:3-oxoacyl-[acyl-carrier-protein] synthase 2 n=1 Tax=uncultured Chthoniobacterales bacterium TaxID=1836801 RepID=A0A6J4IS68_9BACT|nr:MAG: 3-oxoacyl-[acyl-carrier-protein] synthase, KASII [uncultured Chthoniobacterales bacterium]
MRNGKQRRAVITGIGPITCVGIGKDAFWRGILAEKSGIRQISTFDTSPFHAHCGGEIREWVPENHFPPHRLKRLDRYAQFAVASAKMALDDAGLAYSREQPQHRVGVSFGTALGGISGAENQHSYFLKKGTRGVNQTLALQVFGGSAHSNIAIEFGLRGVGTTNSNSCASGTVAVGEALRYIRDDFADVVIAGGAEAPLSPLTFGAFAIIKTMSQSTGDPAQACRPFDSARDGFVMGEGAASLVIEELEHARARGAHIYAEVLGYSLTNDAYHMTSPLPTGDSCIRAIRDALADAKLAPEQIDYVNAHASSTQLSDSTETMTLKQAFGDHASRLAVSGTKAFTGHPLGATGAMEAAICALGIEHGWIPPTLNRDTPDAACDLDVVPQHGRAAELNYVLSNSFGFGGINSCVVLGRVA